MTASLKAQRQHRVVSTRRRTAASGKRNFNDNFPATNSKRRQSHSDPHPTYDFQELRLLVTDACRHTPLHPIRRTSAWPGSLKGSLQPCQRPLIYTNILWSTSLNDRVLRDGGRCCRNGSQDTAHGFIQLMLFGDLPELLHRIHQFTNLGVL